MTDINEIAEEIFKNASEKGFHNDAPYDTPEFNLWSEQQMNNLHDEVSELHEAYRAGEGKDLCDKADKMVELNLTPLTKEEEEYADIIIRCLDQMIRRKLDPAFCILTKHAYNKTRPFKHGKKF